jgi:integrase
MDLPIVEHSEQKRPSLKADPISQLIQESDGQEQALYVLLAATGMRVSEALALEKRHFINGGRTIVVEQQVEKDAPRIVRHLKTDAARREIDLHPDLAEYLRKYMAGKKGLLFQTANGTPHLHGNLAERWLTPRLIKKGLDEKGMGWHAFKRFRKLGCVVNASGRYQQLLAGAPSANNVRTVLAPSRGVAVAPR